MIGKKWIYLEKKTPQTVGHLGRQEWHQGQFLYGWVVSWANEQKSILAILGPGLGFLETGPPPAF